MKIYNKLIALVVACGLVGVSYAQDEAAGGNLTDNISIAGFVDAAYTDNDDNGTDSSDIGIEQIEIDFLFGFGSVSGEVHIQSDGAGNIELEQAFLTYDAGNSISVTVGQYGSALGLEREDPQGLYTVSRAYRGAGLNLGDADNNTAQGVAFSYASGDFSARLSLQDDNGALDADDNLDTEISVAYTGIENLVLGGGVEQGNGDQSTDITNVHATYTAGKTLIAAEWIELDSATVGDDVEAYSIIVDYDLSDKLGIAIRVTDEDSDTAADDVESVTIAPNYAITDDLGAILEFSDVEAGGYDYKAVSLELTLTF